MRARRVSDQFECVVKLVVLCGTAASCNAAKLICNEADVLHTLHHKNIVECLDSGLGHIVITNSKDKTQECLPAQYIVLEYLAGGSLFDILKSRDKLDGRWVKRTCRTLVETIQFIHKAGLAHRDIKPENIMFNGRKRLKIIDFGLTSPRVGDYGNGLCYSCSGSRPYMAPEIAFASFPIGYYADKADIYALGLTLFAIHFHFVPLLEPYPWVSASYQHQNFWDYVHSLTGKTIEPLLQHLITFMLLPNPADRPSLEQVLTHSWLV